LVKQYKKLFDMEGIKLIFDDEALDYIVEQAIVFNLGARGLRSICEAILTDAMFELPSDKTIKTFVVSKDYAQKKFEHSTFYEVKLVA
jgi:ATP-dependent Clp protease ATP-binding subunit ClpX